VNALIILRQKHVIYTYDMDHTRQPRTSRMDVKTAQVDELILEADMCDVSSLTVMRN
jgi:hypothetical protein